MRARPTTAPEATAQLTASGHVTVGCAGLSGGSLPLASFHVVVSSLRATSAPSKDATIARILWPVEPVSSSSAISPVSYPPSREHTRPRRRTVPDALRRRPRHEHRRGRRRPRGRPAALARRPVHHRRHPPRRRLDV